MHPIRTARTVARLAHYAVTQPKATQEGARTGLAMVLCSWARRIAPVAHGGQGVDPDTQAPAAVITLVATTPLYGSILAAEFGREHAGYLNDVQDLAQLFHGLPDAADPFEPTDAEGQG